MICFRVSMKKYLWIVLFFVTTLCFAQPNAAINQASTDNNLVIQLVDSKLVNFDNKIAAVAQSNQDGIADLKARTDEKLADKFKQLDDRSGLIDRWLSVVGILLTFFGLMIPLGALLFSRKIDENIKDSQAILERETKQAVEQIASKVKEADKLINKIKENHQELKKLKIRQEETSSKPPLIKLSKQGMNNVSTEKPENQLAANDWFIKGLNAHHQQDYYSAIAYYTEVIKLNKPETLNSSVYSNRGVAKFKLGHYSEAIKDYDVAIELNDKNYEAYFNRAIANKMLENNELALKDYDKAIELNPYKPDAYNNRGVVNSDLGDYDSAISDYNQAIQLDKNDADGYNNRGLVHFKLEDYDKALLDLNKAIMLNPNKPDAYINRGAVKSKIGQNQEAISDYDQAIRINPNNIEFYNNRGVTLIKLQRYDDAIKDYDIAIKLAPKNVNAYFNKACAYALMKNKIEALKWLDKALQLAYPVNEVLKDEDWAIYLDDADFKNLLAKYNK